MRKKSRRGLALLLVFCLMTSLVPASVFGAENGANTGGMGGGSGPTINLQMQYDRNDAELLAMVGRIQSLENELKGDNSALAKAILAANKSVHLPTMYQDMFVQYSGLVLVVYPTGIMGESKTYLEKKHSEKTLPTKIAVQELLLSMGKAMEGGLKLASLMAKENIDLEDLTDPSIIAFLAFSSSEFSSKIDIAAAGMDGTEKVNVGSKYLPVNFTSKGFFKDTYMAIPKGAFKLIDIAKEIVVGKDVDPDELVSAYAFIMDAVTGNLFKKYEGVNFSNINDGTIEVIDLLIGDLSSTKKTLSVADSLAASIGKLLGYGDTDAVSLIVALLGAEGELNLGDFIDDLLASQAPELAGLGIGKLINSIFGEAAAKDLTSAQVHQLIDDGITSLENLKTEIKGDDTNKGIDLNAAKKLVEDIISGEVTNKYDRLTLKDINDIPELNKMMGYVKADLDGCIAILKTGNLLDKEMGKILGDQRVSDIVLQYISQTLPGLIDDLLNDQHSALGQLGIGEFITKELLKPAGMLSLERAIKHLEEVADVVAELCKATQKIEDIYLHIKSVDEEQAKECADALLELLKQQMKEAVTNNGDIQKIKREIERVVKDAEAIYKTVKETIDQVKALEECLKEVLTEENAKALVKALWDRYEDQIIAAITDCINGSDLGDTIAKIKEAAKEIKDIYLCVKDAIDQMKDLEECLESILTKENAKALAKVLWDHYGDQIISAIKDCANSGDVIKAIEKIKEAAKEIRDIYHCVKDTIDKLEKIKKWAEENLPAEMQQWAEQACKELKDQLVQAIQNSDIPELVAEIKVIAKDVDDIYTLATNPNALEITAKKENTDVFYTCTTNYDHIWTKYSDILQKLNINKDFYVNFDDVNTPNSIFTFRNGNELVLKSGAALSGDYNVKISFRLSTTYKGKIAYATLGTKTVKVSDDPTVVDKYTVNFDTISGNGIITAKVDGIAIADGDLVAEGKTVDFTAAPHPGYQVKEWTVNGAAQAGTSTTLPLPNINTNTTVTVEFEAIAQPAAKYPVNFNVIGGNGAITATVDGIAIAGGDLVAEGKTVDFTAAPHPGYQVKEWTVNGTSQPGTSTTYTLDNLSVNTTITVEFKAITQPVAKHAVNFDVIGGNGTITAKVDGIAIADGDLVTEGKTVDFTAAPHPGYQVKEWTVNGTSQPGTSTTYTLDNLSANTTVIVEFKATTQPVAKHAVNFDVIGGNGTITAKVDGIAIADGDLVTEGKTVTFTATPDSNYEVKEWIVNGTAQSGTSATHMISNLNKPTTVTVEFEPEAQTVKHQVRFSVLNGNGSLTATVDSTAITNSAYVVKSKTIIFTAAPNSNYKVKEWKLNGSVVSGVAGNTYTLSDLNSDAVVTVEFTSSGTSGGGGGGGGASGNSSSNKNDQTTTIADDKTPLGATLSLASAAVDSADMIPYYTEGGKDHFAPFSVYQDGRVYYLAEEGKTYSFKANPKEFNDIAGHWALSNINFTASREIFAGVAPQEFAPNATVTRGMFVTVLGRMASVDANGSTNSGFGDVGTSAWYASYVTWAAKNGIVTGANGSFNPDQTISRQDMAVMLDRFVKHMDFKLDKTGSAAEFSDDAAISGYAKAAVKNMQGANLLTGRTTGEFDPMGQASRAEVSAMLSRLIERAMDNMITAEKAKN